MKIDPDQFDPSDVKHQSLDTTIRAQIASGALKPGEQLPTWDELEQIFSVSRGTVMRAIGRLKDDGFVQSLGGRRGMTVAKKPPCLFNFAIVFPCSPNDRHEWSHYWEALREEFDRAAKRVGAWMTPYYGVRGPMHREQVVRFVDDVRAYRMAGLVFATPVWTFSLGAIEGTPHVAKLGVMAGPHFPGFSALHAQINMFPDLAIDHLASRGRKRVALLLASSEPDGLELDGWNEKLAARGLVSHRKWQQSVGHWADGWAANVIELLFQAGDHEKPDALIITDDHLADTATRTLKEMGVRVPEDLEIVTQANFPWKPTCHVPTTCIGFDTTRIMSCAVDYIQRHHRGDRLPVMTRFPPVFEHQFEAGESEVIIDDPSM